MIIRRYLVWASTATASQRAKAADALVRAYVQSPLSPSERDDVLKALDDLARDEAPVVRQALAEAFRKVPDAPVAILSALARDPDVALPPLAASPALTTDQLVDSAAVGDVATQMAIAGRRDLAAPVAAALAEVAPPEVLVKLAANPGATLSPAALERMLDRLADDPGLEAALSARRDLPPFIRQAIAARMAKRLAAFAMRQGWVSTTDGERLERDGREAAAVALAVEADDPSLARLVAHLTDSDQLTISLLLRALLSGAGRLVAFALADLADVAHSVAHAVVYDRKGAGFARLYVRAGLADAFLPVFSAAVEAFHDEAVTRLDDGRLSSGMVAYVIDVCRTMPADDMAPVLALLEAFATEAADHAPVSREASADAAALMNEAKLAFDLPHALAA
jgi:uncharacterized protein (DUF2336 family)